MGIVHNKKPVELDRFLILYSFRECTPLKRGSNVSAPVAIMCQFCCAITIAGTVQNKKPVQVQRL